MNHDDLLTKRIRGALAGRLWKMLKIVWQAIQGIIERLFFEERRFKGEDVTGEIHTGQFLQTWKKKLKVLI
ncbi:MAG: hypothetical protein ACO3ZG_04565 [Kiritimatiellia bacterium]